MPLPRKQRSSQADWLHTLEGLRRTADRGTAEQMVDRAAEGIRIGLARGAERPAYAWSGGKDSVVLGVCAERAGVTQAALTITDLEYQAFLAWATDNMPAGLTVIRRPWNLAWLATHPEMLFPGSDGASRWFSGVQGWGLRRYCRTRDIDVLLMGRRRDDGNYCGPNGQTSYRDRGGFIRWSPLANWTHEQVLYVIAALDLPLAPCYSWPRGFRVGTGSWPARQWTTSIQHGWSEVWEIDPAVVRNAAAVIPSARDFLACVA